MRLLEWMRAVPMRGLVLSLGAVLTVAAVALARLVMGFRQRMTREEPVLRCIRELRWDSAWPAAEYRERLARRLRTQLGVGAHRRAVRGRRRVDLSFDYQDTTWFIAVQERLPDTRRAQVEREVAELLVECVERRVRRPTVAVVVGVPSGVQSDNLGLRALRAALVCGRGRPHGSASSDFNFEVVAVPLARTSVPPPAPAGA
jgi:hypothetical protein